MDQRNKRPTIRIFRTWPRYHQSAAPDLDGVSVTPLRQTSKIPAVANHVWIMQTHQSTPAFAADGPAPKPAKRPRAAQACDRCRKKKYKCDEQYPCSHCKSRVSICAPVQIFVWQQQLNERIESQLNCVYQGNYRERESSRSAR